MVDYINISDKSLNPQEPLLAYEVEIRGIYMFNSFFLKMLSVNIYSIFLKIIMK